MTKRAFIVHGYLGYPQEAWLPWIKTELEKHGFQVALPLMPDPARPIVSEWTRFIDKLVGEPDRNTVMIAHSVGCHAVLRYLETLGETGKSVGKTVLVAGRYPAGMSLQAAREKAQGDEALLPWLTLSVDPAKVAKAIGKCTFILSDNDPYIPFKEAKAGIPDELAAELIVEAGKGHFNEDDRVNELPSALKAAIT